MARPGQHIYVDVSSLSDYDRRAQIEINRQTRQAMEKDIRDDMLFGTEWLDEIAGWQKMAEGFDRRWKGIDEGYDLGDENDEPEHDVMLEDLETMNINKESEDELTGTPGEVRMAFAARNAAKSKSKRDENSLARGLSKMKVRKTTRRRTVRESTRFRTKKSGQWAKELAENRDNVIRLYVKKLGAKRARLEEFDLAEAADRTRMSEEEQLQILPGGATFASAASADDDMGDGA